MPRYAAFLRAINVGGNGIIKMQDLKQLFEAQGHKNVSTYIQSGNVVFETSKKPQTVENSMEKALLTIMDSYKVDVFVRNEAQLQEAVDNYPFDTPPDDASVKVYVGFLKEQPSPENIEALLAMGNEIDSYHVRSNEVYVMIRKDGKSNMTPKLLEKKLKLSTTTRNWNTLNKMIAMLQQ